MSTLNDHCSWTDSGGKLDFRKTEGTHSTGYYLYLPSNLKANPDFLIVIHGISRNAREQAEHYRTVAEYLEMPLIAPLFDKENYPGYQRLSNKKPGKRADLILHRIINEVSRHTGSHAPRLHLVGYSGGAQFAHRFALVHPRRVSSLTLCSAGWYTFPDKKQPYPRGLKTRKTWPPITPDFSGFLNIPVQILVGSADVVRDESLNKNPVIDQYQGRNRLERANNWKAAIQQAKEEQRATAVVSIKLLRNEGHDFVSNIKNSPMTDHISSFIQQHIS